MRLKDCATLRFSELDMARGIIRRVPSKTARRNPKPVIVPIHPVLRSMLDEIPKENRGEYILPDTAKMYLEHKKNLIVRIQKHIAESGVTTHKPGTGPGTGKRAVVEVGFHSLRHTFVSLCRASNAPLAVVESIVGHSNPSMTRHYTHVGELAAGRAVAALPSVIGEHKPERNGQENALAKIRSIAKSITAATWKNKKAELLALLEGSAAITLGT